jgi:glycosyltransferase 2 family protein
MQTMSRITTLTLAAGLIVAVALVVWFGAGAIGAAIASLGWLGLLALCIAHAPVVALLGAGWRVCLRPNAAASLPGVIWARVLRDAGAEVLPFSEIGGMVIGARAAMLAGLSGAEAAASTLVDLTTEVIAQIAFIALGLLALEKIQPGAAIVRPVLVGLVVCVALGVLMALCLRRTSWLPLLASGAAKRWLLAFGEVDDALALFSESLERPGALFASFALHLLAWLAVALEAWFALRLIGAPISLEAAVAMESLLFASRSLGFFMPNALGVQEGVYALLAPLVGLAPTDALALSLVKRARDLVIGAPALLIWQRNEASRAWSRRNV